MVIRSCQSVMICVCAESVLRDAERRDDHQVQVAGAQLCRALCGPGRLRQLFHVAADHHGMRQAHLLWRWRSVQYRRATSPYFRWLAPGVDSGRLLQLALCARFMIYTKGTPHTLGYADSSGTCENLTCKREIMSWRKSRGCPCHCESLYFVNVRALKEHDIYNVNMFSK